MDLRMSSREEAERICCRAREVHLSDVIELFQDPETETKSAGYAFVWAILKEDDAYFELQVSFLSDPAGPGRKFTRKYRKYPAAQAQSGIG